MTNKIAIHVPTWDEYLRLGITKNGITRNMWVVYGNNTCVNKEGSGWMYCGQGWYLDHGYTIYTVDQYLESHGKLKEKLVNLVNATQNLEYVANAALEAAKENLDKKLSGGIPVGEMAMLSSNAVGDIHSNEKGSGARYNNGKPDYSMLVLSDIIPLLSVNEGISPHYDTLVSVLVKLGVFQQTHDVTYLYHALEILGMESVEEATFVFTYGAEKYAAWNWTKGMAWSVPLACAVRHSLATMNGELVDKESGRKHVGHIVCNIMMLIHYTKYYKEGNDLPPVEMFKE